MTIGSFAPAPAPGRPDLDTLAEQVRALVAEQMQRLPTAQVPGNELQRRVVVDRLLDEALRSYTEAAIHSGTPGLDSASRTYVTRRVRDALLALGPLQPLL